MNRRAVSISDDQRAILVARQKLVIGSDRVGLMRPVKVAFRLVHIRCGNRRPQILHAQRIAGERGWIRLNAYSRLLSAADADQADTRQLRNLLGKMRIGKVLDFGQRERLRCECQSQYRRIGGVDLAVDRRIRKVPRQKTGTGIDRGLDFLFRNIDAQVERKLKRNDGASRGAG